MSQRDIAETIDDIYGFKISHEAVSAITDRVIETVEGGQNRPLKKFYTFLFVDCLYVSIRKEMETKNCAVYVILGYDADGNKDILGLWVGEAEGKHYWMQIFDEIKARGVEDVLFINMDGVSGLEPASWSSGCMGTQLAACGTAVQLWERGTQASVRHEQYKSGEFEFPESNEKGGLPRGGCGEEGAVPADHGTV